MRSRLSPGNAILEIAVTFENSNAYWRKRYETGGNSGKGSYGSLAEFKAEFLNRFVELNKVAKVIELGCGDGNQLRYARYPKYVGYDISDVAVRMCTDLFRADASKAFHVIDDRMAPESGDLAMSLDVIYHLVEDEVFDRYMRRLFAAAKTFVVIYAGNREMPPRDPHVRQRRFSEWIDENAEAFAFAGRLENGARLLKDENGKSITSPSEFFVYVRTSAMEPVDVVMPVINPRQLAKAMD